MSASSTVANAMSGGFERIEEDGVEYLVHDVVAQKEGVYYYPDPEGGIQKEFVSTEELHAAAEETDNESLLLDHPDAPKGTPKLTTNPRANSTEIGRWRIDKIDSGIGGSVFIRLNEIGEHDGAVRKYINQVNQRGVGEVSTGYDIQSAEPSTGRYNGQPYDATQRGINLDHLAILPDKEGDCSVEKGCGIGRANEHDASMIRVNNHIPTDDADATDEESAEVEEFLDAVEADELDPITDSNDDGNVFKGVAQRLIRALGASKAANVMRTGSPSTGRANEMNDQEKIDELVEEHGLDRENVAHLAGEDCLERIYSQFSEESETRQNNMGDNEGDDNGGNDDVTFTEEQREEISSMVEDSVPSADEIADQIEVPTVESADVDEDQIVEKTAQEVEQARAHQKRVQKIAESDELPHIDEERAGRMNEDLVKELTEDLEESEETSPADRANQAGRPSGGSFNADDYDTSGDEFGDIPSGPKRLGEGGN